MKDLYRSLYEYNPIMIAALAEMWDVDLPDGEMRTLVEAMAEAMLCEGVATSRAAQLTQRAQRALSELVAAGGMVASHRLTVRYGEIRRMGTARLEREKPWHDPENAIEELYYAGLIHRAYGAIGDYRGEVLHIPQQLLDALGELAVMQPDLLLELARAPAAVRSDGLALMEDVFLVLVGLRESRIHLINHEMPRVAPLDLAGRVYGPRLYGQADAERIDLVWRLVMRMHLVSEEQGFLRPNARAREWLRIGDATSAYQLYVTWRDDTKWDELRRVKSLHCENTGWRNDPVAARRNLIDLLAQHDWQGWVKWDSIMATLKRDRPDFMRPDGDWESWHIRDAETDAYLSGFSAWDQVDGALAQHVLCNSMRWLGLADVGYAEDDDERPVAWRLTELGRMCIFETEIPKRRSAQRQLTVVDPAFNVRITMEDTLYERYQLERFAEWCAEDDWAIEQVATYQVTADSVWASQSEGVKMEQVGAFLRRTSHDQLPLSVQRLLQAWGGRFGRAFLRRVLLLQTVDERTMRQIRAKPAIRQLLGDALSDTSCLVDERHVEELVDRLKTLGIWPHVRL